MYIATNDTELHSLDQEQAHTESGGIKYCVGAKPPSPKTWDGSVTVQHKTTYKKSVKMFN